MNLFNLLLKHTLSKLLIIIYFGLLIFWMWIFVSGSKEGLVNNIYGALYPIISLIAGTYGLFIVSKEWGGLKSVLGKGVIFLSLGLLAQVFGQWTWSYYTIIAGVEIPYPSVADVGYFLIVPFYILAMFNFAKAAGIKVGLKNFSGKLQAVIIPLLMIAVAYILFLRGIEVDFINEPIRTFLDFGYPGFEAIAISIGILTYSLSRGILGGRMRSRILYFVFALVAAYITDYTFLYLVGIEEYYNAGPVDLMYTTSFLIMSLGLISLTYQREEDYKLK